MPNRGGRDRDARDAKYARLPRSAFEPLRITAWLQSPIITDGTLPIDGVLYYLAHREALGSQAMTIPGGMAHGGHSGATLPLARCEEHSPMWYYAASFAQWGGVTEGQDHWNCRVDESLCYLVDFGPRKAKIDISSGQFKSYHMPVFYRHSLSVKWYVVGNRRSVAELLRFATHLGKKTSQGWGSVLRWDVEPWPADWSVRGPGGELMRAVPADEGILMGYRPSYWAPGNQTICRA